MTDTYPSAQTAQHTSKFPANISRLWASLDRVQRGWVVLTLARLILALLFMLDILPLDMRFGWYLHHGGDQEYAFSLAQSLIRGIPEASVVGLGQPLVMVPWIVLLKAHYYLDIVVPLVLINGFLLGSLSVPLVGSVARRITGDDRVGLWSAVVWAFLPLLTYYGFFWHFDPVILRSSYVPVVGWLNGLTDGPAIFWILLAILLLARPLDKAEPPSLWHMAGAGAACGVGVVFRVHIAPMVAILLVYIVVVHGWRALVAACVAGLIAYLPQAVYNQIMFGFPIWTGYISLGSLSEQSLDYVLHNLPFSPAQLVELWNYTIGRRGWLVVPLGLVLLVSVYAIVMLWRRRGWRAVALLIGPPAAYLGLMTMSWPFRLDMVRFSMPAYPYVIIACIYAVWSVGKLLQGRHRQYPPPLPQNES